jgi:Tol biopolymer transport system component
MGELRPALGRLRDELTPRPGALERHVAYRRRKEWRRRGVAAAVAAVTAVAGLGLAVWALYRLGDRARPAAPAIGNGKIAFTSGRGGYHIAAINPDGSGLSDLSSPGEETGLEYDLGPVWSHDGTRIAFLRYTITDFVNGMGDYEIFVANADGTDVRNLTPWLGEGSPTWSPDGSRIAFHRFSEERHDVYVAHGDKLMRITEGVLSDEGQAWSPEGTRLVIARGVDGSQDLYAVSIDGTGLTRLTDTPGYDGDAAWSPDGSRIAFVSARSGRSALYLMAPDGSAQRQVSEVPGPVVSATWSPDGTRIAFEVQTGRPDTDIYVVDADGSGQYVLAGTPRDEVGPEWAPDGSWIAYSAAEPCDCDNAGSFDVYLVRADGSGRTRLTEEALELGGDLSWQPLLLAEAIPEPIPSPAASPTPSEAPSPSATPLG